MYKKIHDIFGPGSNSEGRIFQDYDILKQVVNACKQLGLKIVLTSGTFDLFHVGHSRYLEKAKEKGDLLIVGVDCDEKVKNKKGPHRPVVNENERMEIICHCRHADVVFLKKMEDVKWKLVKIVQPDVLIVTKRVYDREEDLTEINDFCGEVSLLESQATTSTTAKVRDIFVKPKEEIKKKLKQTIEEFNNFLDEFI